MSLDLDFLEGERPAIAPNAGQHVELRWTDADRQLLSNRIRRKYPNVIFYENMQQTEEGSETKPDIRFIRSLDEAGPSKTVTALFPPPAWRPELVRVGHPIPPTTLYWTWANYLSPIISFSVRPDRSERCDWFGAASNAPIEVWRGALVQTSFRREIEAERKIRASVLRMAAHPCRQLVPVSWESYENYLERKGHVTVRRLRSGRNLATQSVVDWVKSKPGREFEICVWRTWLSGFTTHLPEDVPDSWWGDTPKPKWAQRP